MNWNQREHRPLPKSIAHERLFGGERYCLSNGRMGDCAGEKKLLRILRAAIAWPLDGIVEGV
jgi:hypothetical protein